MTENLSDINSSTRAQGGSVGNDKTVVFIDTDVGWDDWCAIALLTLHPQIHVAGISVNGCGEAYFSDGYKNARNLLQLINILTIPVAKGQGNPLSYSNVFPADFRKAVSNVYNYPLPESKAPETKFSATELLQNSLDSYPDLTYLAIGGFTNFTEFLNSGPPTQPKRIVAMGGAVDVSGNVADLFAQAYPNNITGEWNLFVDPEAAAKAVATRSGFLTFVPLDASYKVELTQSVVDMFKDESTPVVKFIHTILQDKLEEAQKGGYQEYFYDPLAAATIIKPDLVSRSHAKFTVLTDLEEENNTQGQLNYQPDASANSEYCHDPDADGFYQLFSATIHQQL